MNGLTWLHLSDWHQKGRDFDRNVVRDALIRDLRERTKIDRALSQVDFVIFSGDVAWQGKAEEFQAARECLFEPVLKELVLPPNQLFIVPGNHDLSREVVEEMLPEALKKPLETDEQVQKWLTDEKRRNRALEPFEAFAGFVVGFTGQKPAAYANTSSQFVGSKTVGILCLNSAWMCGRNRDPKGEVNDYGYLTLGEPQLHEALADLAPSAGLGRDGVEFIRRMRDESGILAMWSAGQCGFLHLTFQEYLAGLHAAREGLAEALVQHVGASWWREVILVAVAIGSRDFAQKFFTALLQTDAVTRDGAFVDQCLDEARYAVLEPFIAALREQDAKQERQLDILRRLRQSDHPDLLAVCRELARAAHPELSALAREVLQRAGIEVERPAIEVAGAPMELRVDPRTGIAFVVIPAGEFDMGAANSQWDDERPVHRVRISKPFLLGKYPVTNREYQRFLEANSGTKSPKYWSNSQFNDPQQPVVGVSWEDAQLFCQWARCRLPTEAEWEYACRAGNPGAYCFGDAESDLEQYAWYSKNIGAKTQPVGQKKPNQWSLYDMHGNVWEWCQDWYSGYSEKPVTDPTGPVKGTSRVLRGGSWINDPELLRSACRSSNASGLRDSRLGFRCVWVEGSSP